MSDETPSPTEPPEHLHDPAVRLFSPAYGGEALQLPERENTEPLKSPE